MKIKSYLILCCSLLFFCFGVAKLTPTSVDPGRFSLLTGEEYNSVDGLFVELYSGIDESKIAKQKYNWNKLFDFSNWNLEKMFPDRQRDLAYKYYTKIPGVIWIERNFFIDETEVTNIYWQEFLLSEGTAWKPHVDTAVFPTDYFINPKFRFFPVVGVSYEEVIKFCEWRTRVITKAYNDSQGLKESDAEYTIIRFQLPSVVEWEKCAGYGLDLRKYPYGFTTLKAPIKFNDSLVEYFKDLTLKDFSEEQLKEQLRSFNKSKGTDYIINCKRDSISFLQLKTPFHVWSNPKNHFGIYNMLGNVAEMVKERGICKGGSWLDPLENCKIKSEGTYLEPSQKIGFRCICILEWPNKK